MITLSIDELRVAAVLSDAAVPGLLDRYATDESGADAAARRGLVARGLLHDGALASELTALLAPLTAVHEVREYEGVCVRLAQSHGPAGTTGFTEVAGDVWTLSTGAVVDTALSDTLAALAARPAAPGGALSLRVEDHLSLLGLLGSPDAVEGFLRHQLGADGRRLADGFAPTAGAGRFIRTVREGDVATVIRTGWLDGRGGVWRVEEGDPDDVEPRTHFVPTTGADVVAAVAAMCDAPATPTVRDGDGAVAA